MATMTRINKPPRTARIDKDTPPLTVQGWKVEAFEDGNGFRYERLTKGGETRWYALEPEPEDEP